MQAHFAEWGKLTKVTGLNRAVDSCGDTQITCSFSVNWPHVTYGYGGANRLETVTDPLGRVTKYTWGSVIIFGYGQLRLTKIEKPGSSSNTTTIGYFEYSNHDGKVSSINRGYATWNYAYSDSSTERTTTITLPGGGTQVSKSTLSDGFVSEDTDPLSRTTSYTYDSEGRVTKITAPEGNYVEYTYDSRGNITQTKAVAKSGSGLSNITTSASYPSSCSNKKTCNKPVTTTDANGKVTNYSYNSTHGGVTVITAPDPDGSGPLVRPETRYTYASKQARYKSGSSSYTNGPATYVLTETSACATLSSCANGSDETRTVTTWPTTSSPNNLQPVSVTIRSGDNAISSTTTTTYNDFGWPGID